MTVTPASDIPERIVERKQKLVIGNLQRTPLHKVATINIHAFTDTIMQGVMERLNISIPPWILRRRVHINCQEDLMNDNEKRILIEGRDPNNPEMPFTLFHSVQVMDGQKIIQELTFQPFQFNLDKDYKKSITIRLHFFGHYNELPFDLTYPDLISVPNDEHFYLFYNPMKGIWKKTHDIDDIPV